MSAEAAANREVLRELRRFPDTDGGNGEAFKLLHGDRFRFDHTRRLWLVWNGRYWARDVDGAADRAALQTARKRRSAAASMIDSLSVKERIGWALWSESVWRRKAMLESARSMEGLATTSACFDRKHFLLTVGNGTLDLRAGKLRPVRPEDLITRASDIPYDATARCPEWERFLQAVFNGDAALINFVWRAVGYSLTGDTREQCLFLLFGLGANGKSTFLEILLRLLGHHAATTPFSTFMLQKNQGPRNDLAALHGARLVKAVETQRQAALDEPVIKEITGGDTIAARFLYGEFFSFKPKFKVWLATNQKPVIRGTEDAIWRRIRLIPFNRQFKGSHRDPTMSGKLVGELDGIQAWAVRGCLFWQKQGLGEAPSVESATSQYRQESDQVGRFLEDKCLFDREHQISGSELYEAYASWSRSQGEEPEPNNVFARSIAGRRIIKKRGRQGMLYQGLGLLPDRVPVSLRPQRRGRERV